MFKFLGIKSRLILFTLFLAVGFLLLYSNRNKFVDCVLQDRRIPKALRRVISKILPRPIVTVFIHGTVGTTVSLLDIGAVSQDLIEGTPYKAVIARMRNHTLFWKDQMVMERGLVFLNKYFDKSGSVIENKITEILAAPVMANAFIKIAKLIGIDRKILTFAYGWTGLLSQTRRRREALRLYNELSKQLLYLENFHGIFDPEVILICYSHGGSLALNLAGVYNACHLWPEKEFLHKSPDTVEAFDKMLGDLKANASKEGEAKGDCLPCFHNFKVAKLVLLGCPIQPESSCFAHSKFFQQVLNVYSQQDTIQTADYFSSKEAPTVRAFGLLPGGGAPNITDIQLTNGALREEELKSLEMFNKEQKKMAWWQAFFGMKDMTRHSLDPTHKELWFFCFDKSNTVNFDANPLRPLPVLVFVPMLLYSLQGLGRSIMVNFAFAGGGDLVVKGYSKECPTGKSLGRIDGLALIGLKRVDGFRYSAEEAAKIQDFVKSLVHFSKKIQKQG